MPFVETSTADFKCIWVEGPPNSGKTYSLRTLPRPLVVISVPGEKGHASIPYGDGVVAHVWKDDETPAKNRDTLYYMKIWREVEQVTWEAIQTKPASLVIDGAHKLYKTALAIATDGESERLQAAFREEAGGSGKLVGEFDPRCYGKSHTLYWKHINMVASSPVEYRVFTSWCAPENDDPDDKRKDAPKHLLPDLPGKAASLVLGEVSVVLHATISPKGEYVWQTKPGGKVYGAGIKGHADVVAKVPMFIPQDFKVLEGYLK